MIKLSIITINYNNKEGLASTIKSVSEQKGINNLEYEYIVVDGMSDDGSGDLIKKNSCISKYIIEKDDGIADAFNKGIRISKGSFLFFLNSGDMFFNNNSLKNIMKNIDENLDLIFSNIAMVECNNDGIIIIDNKWKGNKQKIRNYIAHQGILINRKLFHEIGLYDTSYKLGMDYEWSLRLLKLKRRLNIRCSDQILSKMLIGGVSQTMYIKTFLAYHKARKKHKILPFGLSFPITHFFILKRTIGILYRKYFA